MPELLLKIDHVSMSYGKTVVLRDVNAEIEHTDKGRIVCFLGPSGMGKTQLSRIIAGLLTPTAGQVILRDGKAAGRGRACMVPQFYPMFDYTTVKGNLQICGRQGGLEGSALSEKVNEMVEIFGLGEHLGKYPRDLSGGSKQRVAIARQLMCPSDYMIMDEPFSGLDPIMKSKAAKAIVKLASRSSYQTVIVVTHDVTEGLVISDRVWMLGQELGLPGARLVYQYDLLEIGFQWSPELEWSTEFLKFVREVKDRFSTLRVNP